VATWHANNIKTNTVFFVLLFDFLMYDDGNFGLARQDFGEIAFPVAPALCQNPVPSPIAARGKRRPGRVLCPPVSCQKDRAVLPHEAAGPIDALGSTRRRQGCLRYFLCRLPLVNGFTESAIKTANT
jgi:hypothetical protein